MGKTGKARNQAKTISTVDLLQSWADTPSEDIYRRWIPFLLEDRTVLPDDHPVHQLLDRWDPVEQKLAPCSTCGCAELRHTTWCSEAVNLDGK
jgi:hypothetical protein